MPRKPNRSAGDGPATHAAKVCVAWVKYPLIADHLVSLTYGEGGEERQPSVLVVRVSGGAWHLKLTEPTQRLQLRVSGETYTATLAALEALLGQPAPPWEVDTWAEERASRPRRKRS